MFLRSINQLCLTLTYQNSFDSTCRPYLCNLAVLPPYRGQGLGCALARHAERVVGEYWKEKVIYLHLDEASAVACMECVPWIAPSGARVTGQTIPQTDPAASSLWAAMGYTRVLGAGPSGWYQVRDRLVILKRSSALWCMR